MTTDVCIPWRDGPGRLLAFTRCVDYWNRQGFNVITADSDPAKPFLCNQSRNNAVRQATSMAVVIADGDTLPEHVESVHKAISLVVERDYDVVWPFTVYRHIPAEWVRVDDLLSAPVVKQYRGSPAGILVVNRERFWDIGGFDEKFVPGQWGYDDSAFAIAARTLLRTTRLPGVVYSFDHPVDGGRDLSDDNANKYRYTLYHMASGRPAKMRQLIGTCR